MIEARSAARQNLDKRRQELTTFMDDKNKTGGDDGAKVKLDEFRKSNETDQQKLKEAQTALREVLTVENETRLAAIGVLD